MNRHDDDYRPLRRTFDEPYGRHSTTGFNNQDVVDFLRTSAIPRYYDPHYRPRHARIDCLACYLIGQMGFLPKIKGGNQIEHEDCDSQRA